MIKQEKGPSLSSFLLASGLPRKEMRRLLSKHNKLKKDLVKIGVLTELYAFFNGIKVSLT